jgi:hypothetical protein
MLLSARNARPCRDPNCAWSELVQTAGYFDQAHFSKEFKDFTGHTSSAYLTLRRRFPAKRRFPPDNGPMPAD